MDKMKKLHIYISNMCSDDNKGDLAILDSTVKLLRNIWPESIIMIQNVDYSLEDIERLKLNRWSKRIVDKYFGSFFSKNLCSL